MKGKCNKCDSPLFAGRCRECDPIAEVKQVQRVKAVACAEPDWDARRKDELADYGCCGRQARFIRNEEIKQRSRR
jgi:hypothetical protein